MAFHPSSPNPSSPSSPRASVAMDKVNIFEEELEEEDSLLRIRKILVQIILRLDPTLIADPDFRDFFGLHLPPPDFAIEDFTDDLISPVPLETVASWLGLDPAWEGNVKLLSERISWHWQTVQSTLESNFEAFAQGAALNIRDAGRPPLTPRRASAAARVTYVPGHPSEPPEQFNSVAMFEWWTEVLKWLHHMLKEISVCVSKPYAELNILDSGPLETEVGEYKLLNLRRDIYTTRDPEHLESCMHPSFVGPEYLPQIDGVPTLEDMATILEFRNSHHREMVKHYIHLFYLSIMIEEIMIPMVNQKLDSLRKGKIITADPDLDDGKPVEAPVPETKDDYGDARKCWSSRDAKKKISIRILGVGGGASKLANRMAENAILSQSYGVEMWVLDSDVRIMKLPYILPLRKLIIGEKETVMSARQTPERALNAAKDSADLIRRALEGSDVVLIMVTLGGGTGSGASPVIAEIAKSLGVLTVGVASTPFELEGQNHIDWAQHGLLQLRNNVDMLISIPAETLGSSFDLVDNGLEQRIHDFCDIMHLEPDVYELMKYAVSSSMGVGAATGCSKVKDAVLQAVSSPFLDIKIEKADAIVLCFFGGPDLTKSEVDGAWEIIRKLANQSCKMTHLSKIDTSLSNEVRIIMLAMLYPEPENEISEDINGDDQIRGQNA